MAGIHKFSGSFFHTGSTAQFESGIITTQITSTGTFSGVLSGNGEQLTNLQFGSSKKLFFGSESLDTPPTYGNWIKGGGGNQTILLSTSSSNGLYNHFTFLKLDPQNAWIEVSNYAATQNGIASVRSLEQELGTGVHEYLLLAMSTASKETATAGVTVIINPEEFE